VSLSVWEQCSSQQNATRKRLASRDPAISPDSAIAQTIEKFERRTAPSPERPRGEGIKL
jgi:hypothetical protein